MRSRENRTRQRAHDKVRLCNPSKILKQCAHQSENTMSRHLEKMKASENETTQQLENGTPRRLTGSVFWECFACVRFGVT